MDKKITVASDSLCSTAIYALLSWLNVLPASQFEKTSILNLLNFALLAADKKSTEKPMLIGADNQIRKAGFKLLSFLMKISLHNPLAAAHFKAEGKLDKTVKSFLLQEKRVLTIREVFDSDHHTRNCILTVRDCTGKWSWTVAENVDVSKSNGPFASSINSEGDKPDSFAHEQLFAENDLLDEAMKRNTEEMVGTYDATFLESEQIRMNFDPISPNMQVNHNNSNHSWINAKMVDHFLKVLESQASKDDDADVVTRNCQKIVPVFSVDPQNEDIPWVLSRQLLSQVTLLKKLQYSWKLIVYHLSFCL
jgi:hypothetical protein